MSRDMHNWAAKVIGSAMRECSGCGLVAMPSLDGIGMAYVAWRNRSLREWESVPSQCPLPGHQRPHVVRHYRRRVKEPRLVVLGGPWRLFVSIPHRERLIGGSATAGPVVVDASLESAEYWVSAIGAITGSSAGTPSLVKRNAKREPAGVAIRFIRGEWRVFARCSVMFGMWTQIMMRLGNPAALGVELRRLSPETRLGYPLPKQGERGGRYRRAKRAAKRVAREASDTAEL